MVSHYVFSSRRPPPSYRLRTLKWIVFLHLQVCPASQQGGFSLDANIPTLGGHTRPTSTVYTALLVVPGELPNTSLLPHPSPPARPRLRRRGLGRPALGTCIFAQAISPPTRAGSPDWGGWNGWGGGVKFDGGWDGWCLGEDGSDVDKVGR
jgi:hypothetical protein